MYVIGQVASDDVCTQKNGLVNIYSQLNSDCLQIRYMIGLAVQQTECQRFMDAIPLRYSANHIFVQDDVTRGMVLNMIGKQTRLITRVHTVSGITELEYLLRCFGIPTDVFPVSRSTISIILSAAIILCYYLCMLNDIIIVALKISQYGKWCFRSRLFLLVSRYAAFTLLLLFPSIQCNSKGH